MRLEQVAIYESIEGYLDRIPIVKVKKDDYITRYDAGKSTCKYYVLDGKVKVINNVGSRKILIDEINDDWFAGEISNVYHQNLNCDTIAVEDTLLLEMENELFDNLLKDDRFAKVFYYKMSQRVYHMYKRLLMNSMYNQKEILASYIIKHAKNSRFFCSNMKSLCETLGFSRRSFIMR